MGYYFTKMSQYKQQAPVSSISDLKNHNNTSDLITMMQFLKIKSSIVEIIYYIYLYFSLFYSYKDRP